MGLDAVVYCNCFRTGKLLELPLAEWGAYVSERTGAIECATQTFEEQLAFDQWLNFRACEHADGILAQHRFGNLALIALIRSELTRSQSDFPVLLNQVLSDSFHSGDYLSQEDIYRLQAELDKLKFFRCSNSDTQKSIDTLRWQMEELVRCAKVTNNPIVF